MAGECFVCLQFIQCIQVHFIKQPMNAAVAFMADMNPLRESIPADVLAKIGAAMHLAEYQVVKGQWYLALAQRAMLKVVFLHDLRRASLFEITRPVVPARV